jgi:hypothetical protein
MLQVPVYEERALATLIMAAQCFSSPGVIAAWLTAGGNAQQLAALGYDTRPLLQLVQDMQAALDAPADTGAARAYADPARVSDRQPAAAAADNQPAERVYKQLQAVGQSLAAIAFPLAQQPSLWQRVRPLRGAAGGRQELHLCGVPHSALLRCSLPEAALEATQAGVQAPCRCCSGSGGDAAVATGEL